jgi:hypothetical protein
MFEWETKQKILHCNSQFNGRTFILSNDEFQWLVPYGFLTLRQYNNHKNLDTTNHERLFTQKPINSLVKSIITISVRYVEISSKTHLKTHSKKSLALDD